MVARELRRIDRKHGRMPGQPATSSSPPTMQLELLPRAEILICGRFASVLSEPTPLGLGRGVCGCAAFVFAGGAVFASVLATHLEVTVSGRVGVLHRDLGQLEKLLEGLAAEGLFPESSEESEPVRVRFYTAGTNIRWDTLRTWLDGASVLAERRGAKARAACRRHGLALAAEPEHILAADNAELARLWPMIRSNRPHVRAPFFGGREVRDAVAYAVVLRAFDRRATELLRRSGRAA